MSQKEMPRRKNDRVCERESLDGERCHPHRQRLISVLLCPSPPSATSDAVLHLIFFTTLILIQFYTKYLYESFGEMGRSIGVRLQGFEFEVLAVLDGLRGGAPKGD